MESIPSIQSLGVLSSKHPPDPTAFLMLGGPKKPRAASVCIPPQERENFSLSFEYFWCAQDEAEMLMRSVSLQERARLAET